LLNGFIKYSLNEAIFDFDINKALFGLIKWLHKIFDENVGFIDFLLGH